MIVVNAEIESTEADIKAMKSVIISMQVASRAEAGCHDYTFSVELSNSTKLRITERWESMAALVAHFATPHMAEFQAAMGAHPPKNVTANFYEASIVSPPGR
ncbi:MAG: quinol monooxygenase YgiN [Candidatus Azotimanducaceae bacterium]|jgi:quinol monooxygenase YgiN